MDKNADKMILALSNEIDKKCDELKAARKEKLRTRLFVLLCITAIVLPTTFVFLGITLAIIFIPIIFLAAGFLLLSPIIINQGEKAYEQS